MLLQPRALTASPSGPFLHPSKWDWMPLPGDMSLLLQPSEENKLLCEESVNFHGTPLKFLKTSVRQLQHLICFYTAVISGYLGLDYTMALCIFHKGLLRGRKLHSGAVCPKILTKL